MSRLIHFADWPLRAKMVALLVAASLLPLGFATWINIREARQRILETTAELLAAQATRIADQLDTLHSGYQRSLQRLAVLPHVVEFCQADSEGIPRLGPAVRATLDVWPASVANFPGMAVLDLAGVVKLATEDQLVGVDLSYHGFVRDAMVGRPVISDVHFAEPVLGGLPVVAYLVPVVAPDQRLVGLMALWVRATSLWDVMKASNEQAGQGSYAVLLDQQGIHIGHSNDDQVIFHPAGKLAPATVDAFTAERRFGEKTRELLEDVKPFPVRFEIARSGGGWDGKMYRQIARPDRKAALGVTRRFKTVSWTVFSMIPGSV